MFYSTTVKNRFLVSVGSNAVRGIISFASGLLIARGLNPSGYGDLMFLIGSFVAIRSLMDMGSASAFYTFLSRYIRGHRFYLSYFAWLALQFVIPLLFIALIIPSSIFERIWLGHNCGIVIIAFLAAFMQQQVWQTVSQIGESKRKTVKVQLLNLSIAMIYLAMVFLLLALDSMTVERLLFIIIVQYTVATLVAYRLLKEDQAGFVENEASFKEICREYWVFCKPMIAVSIVTFLYDFIDKWTLQLFGGASQQGFFQIAYQFSAISLLATSSILNIYWKEIAEAWAKHERIRVANLYHKISRGLVMVGAIITGFLLPWSKQIVMILLGPAYLEAWPVLAVMLLYPIPQSMGQVGSVTLMASGNSRKYMTITVTNLLVAMPSSYFVLAPTSGMWIPGLGLGAIGMASKMVLLCVVFVNIQAWLIARYCEWKFDWMHQVISIPLMIGVGYLAKTLVGLLWNLDNVSVYDLFIPAALTFFIYIGSVVLTLWLQPWLIGVDRAEIMSFIRALRVKFNSL